MPSKSRTVKGSRKRLFIKRPVFIDCNRCSHREESLHVISCLSSHSDVQTFLPRLSLSRRPSHCRAGNISSHRHVTQRGTQADWWGGQTACEETLNKIWQREREDEDGDKTVTSEGGRRVKDEDQRTETQSGTKTSSPEGCRLLKRPDKLFSRWMKFGVQRVKYSVCWEDGFQLKCFARDILSNCWSAGQEKDSSESHRINRFNSIFCFTTQN